jgi:hypothetical protein
MQPIFLQKSVQKGSFCQSSGKFVRATPGKLVQFLLLDHELCAHKERENTHNILAMLLHEVMHSVGLNGPTSQIIETMEGVGNSGSGVIRHVSKEAGR